MMDRTLDAGSLHSCPPAPDASVGLNGRAGIGRRSLHVDFLALELSSLGRCPCSLRRRS